jgi:hypothetical protein
MADENDKQEQEKSGEVENQSSSDTNGFLEDDDAIDQLLMDEMFGTSEQDQRSVDLVEIDEFAEDELDEFAEDNDSAELISEQTATLESSQSEVTAEENSYLDDFDITADDDEIFPEENTNENVSQPDTQGGFESDVIQEALTTNSDDSLEQSSISEEKQETGNNVIAEALTAQVSQLWAEVADVKEQISNTPANDSTDDIDQINKKIKRLFREQEDTSKSNKLLASIAIGMAALATILAIVAMVQISSLDSTVTDLTTLVSDMEESVTEPDVHTQNTLKSLKDSYLLLDNNQQSIRTQLAMLKDQLSNQASSHQNQQELQSIIGELQQQVTDINTKVTELATTIKKLETRKPKKSAKRVSRKKVKASAEWTVNLVSFKQEWYAKKKAAEFKNKGIPVEVVPVKVKGEQWYRLRVTGFKTKYEAGSYASRAKKALNLSSVWVTQK